MPVGVLRPALLVAIAFTLPAPPVAAQAVKYEVSVILASARLFHVKAEFPTKDQDTLYVSLPAWSPGNYEIQNYARYVRHFSASAGGQSLPWDRLDKDTWRVATNKQERVTVAFDCLADTIDLSLARLLPDFGQFLGTNLFLYEEGKLDRPAEVRFALPAAWQVTTALKGSGSGPYTAADYHELADAQTFVGKYTLDSIQVDKKWLRLAVWPGDAYGPGAARNLRTALGKIAQTENRLMGKAPYDNYTVFLNVIREPISFGGGLEHASSQYDIMPTVAFADPAGNLGDFMEPLLAHEYFHLWNVKRIRPAEMWPYDYHAEQYTPLLWWSEGVTDYYADLTALRSGLWTGDQFLRNATTDIQQVESAPEPWSEEDGSVATWINEVFVNSSQLYYPKGALTGMLLDIAMRDATDNAHSLDDVMRALYTRYYQAGKGFTTDQLLALLREFGMPDADDFYRRYINGREPLPYEALFPRAGIAVGKQMTSVPFLGISAPPAEDGKWVVQMVEPSSAADAAGLQPGDILLKVGDIDIRGQDDWGAAFRRRYQGQAGSPLVIVVQRGDQTLSLSSQVQERSAASYSLSRAPSPTPRQEKLWRGLSTGVTGR
ncbi:MAG TPA: PDZ domain-containing protein [Gemmatimonadales bacterium]|nr:PDZ domain-containing protein [Gemmatimonadales bacterium]